MATSIPSCALCGIYPNKTIDGRWNRRRCRTILVPSRMIPRESVPHPVRNNDTSKVDQQDVPVGCSLHCFFGVDDRKSDIGK